MEKTIIHPKWTGNEQDGFDVAMLQLPRATKKPYVALANSGTPLQQSQLLLALGWGQQTLRSGITNKLQQADFMYLTNRICSLDNPAAWGPLIKDQMLCAESRTARACRGTLRKVMFVLKQMPGNITMNLPSNVS